MVLKVRQALEVRKTTIKLPDYGAMVRFDPEREGGHMLPNLRLLVQSKKGTEPARVITNSKGFRNEREFDYEPPPGTFRILFLGDSFVDGMRTDQAKTIGYVLERSLNERRPRAAFERYEVMISGHNNPANAWYYFQRHGHKYHPTLVLLGVTLGNDLTWNAYREIFAPTRDAQGRPALERTGRPGQAQQKGQGLMIPGDAYAPEGPLDGLLRSELRLREYLAAQSAIFAAAVPPARHPLPSAPRHFFATDFAISLGLFHVPLMPEVETIYTDFEEILAGLDAAVAAAGSRLAVVLFAERIQVQRRDWDLLRRLYFLRAERFDLEFPNRRLLEFCRRRGMLCTDSLPVLRAAARRRGGGDFYLLRGDMHYNERGQEVVASGLYDFVRALVESDGDL